MIRVILVIMILLDVGWWRLADERVRVLPRARIWRTLAGLFAGGQIVSLLFLIIRPSDTRATHGPLPLVLLSAVYLWHLLVLPITLLPWIIIRQVWRTTGAIFSRITGRGEKPVLAPVEAPPQGGLTRRQLLTGAAVAVPPLLLGASVAASMRELGTFRVNDMSLRVAGLPAGLDGMTIAHLSDPHIGRFTRPPMLKAIADTVNAMDADLVLFTGDLIDFAIADLPLGVGLMRALRSRFGTYLCLGNHDLIESRPDFIAGVRGAGLDLLIDEQRTLDIRGHRVQLLGADWAKTDFMPQHMRTTLALRDPSAFQILLAHHPHMFDHAADVPLTLSGHTHGGQLMLTRHLGAGAVLFHYISGLYQRGASQLIVNNGVGNWFPLRYNAPAEIIRLTLRA